MSATIEGRPHGQIDCKRVKLPGVQLHQECPSCGYKRTKDYADEYLAFPHMNRIWSLWCWCPECDHEWQVNVRLRIAFEITSYGDALVEAIGDSTGGALPLGGEE